MTWLRLWRAENSNYVNYDYGGGHDDYDRGGHDDYDRCDDEDDDTYIMMKCVLVCHFRAECWRREVRRLLGLTGRRLALA